MHQQGQPVADRKKDRETFTYFLDIANIFVNDCFCHPEIEDESWQKLLKLVTDSEYDVTGFLQTISETRDALRRSANLNLLVDQMLYKMMGGAK